MSKRKRDGKAAAPSPVLSEHEKKLCDYIKSKGDMGAWSKDIKFETKIPSNVVDKSLKSLLAKSLIKSVKNAQSKGKKHYIASEFEPSAEVTGGVWYDEGSLDTNFVEGVRGSCLQCIQKMGVATVDKISGILKRPGVLKAKFSLSDQDIANILGTLVLDKKVVQVKSTGVGEFSGVPAGKVCFKLPKKASPDKEPKVAAIAEVPCGVCPRIRYCTPDGIINPISCAYYNKLLDF